MDLARSNLFYYTFQIFAANFSGLVTVYSSYTFSSSFKIFATKFGNFIYEKLLRARSFLDGFLGDALYRVYAPHAVHEFNQPRSLYSLQFKEPNSQLIKLKRSVTHKLRAKHILAPVWISLTKELGWGFASILSFGPEREIQ